MGEGKLEIIKYYHEMKNVDITSRSRSDIHISDYWPATLDWWGGDL